MLATLGDLVEDIVVDVDDPVNVASDTDATIVRRRGGSAANVAATAARAGHRSRFVGQVGGDAIGAALLDELAGDGVDVSCCRRGGRTGTIVVLVDARGERSMLTDRGASLLLDGADERWLDGVTTLHVPLYSLSDPPMSVTATTLIGWAHDRSIAVSIDVSSVALIERHGVDEVLELLAKLDPAVVLANGDEATALGFDGPVCNAVTVVKRGAQAVVVHRPGEPRVDVPAIEIAGRIDTTGAGDAFAAGFLSADWRRDVRSACEYGHRVAAQLLRSAR